MKDEIGPSGLHEGLRWSQKADLGRLGLMKAQACLPLWHLVLRTPAICGALSTQRLPAVSGDPLHTYISIWLHPNWEVTVCLYD